MKETIALVDDDRNILTSLSIALEKEELLTRLERLLSTVNNLILPLRIWKV